MQEAKKTRQSSGTLRIATGAGVPQEVAQHLVAQSGEQRVGDALARIFEEHVTDPELRALLHSPNPAIELSVQGDDEVQTEIPLSIGDSWQTVLDALKTAETAELGIAKTHVGGGLSCL